jgi:hypothetical protein
MLENGTEVLISDIKIGDRVQTFTGSKFSTSEVVFLPHPKNAQEATFVDVTLKSGRTIKMTPGHLILVGQIQDPSTPLALIRADQLTTDHYLHSVSGPDEVMLMKQVQDAGVYTLVTMDEFVVVNGVVASPFGTNHYVTNKFYDIHRALYALCPSVLKLPMFKAREATHAVADTILAMTGIQAK